MDLRSKRIIITGGAHGIGKGIAKRFLRAGAEVCILDIDAKDGRKTINELKVFGKICFVRTDVGKESDVRSSMAKAADLLGGIDVLVNNAGMFMRKRLPVEKLSLRQWNRIISVNLSSVFLCTKYALPHLKKKGGSIVNITSTRAHMSEPDTEAYSASKGGILALTHSLAVSLGPKVRVNCISPGWIETGDYSKLRKADHLQHPAGRVGRPEDIAEAVMFLSSDENGFITGVDLAVDGGMMRKMIYIA